MGCKVAINEILIAMRNENKNNIFSMNATTNLQINRKRVRAEMYSPLESYCATRY